MEYVGLTRYDSISRDVNRLDQARRPIKRGTKDQQTTNFPYLQDDEPRTPVSPITLYVNRSPTESDVSMGRHMSVGEGQYNILRYKHGPPAPDSVSTGPLSELTRPLQNWTRVAHKCIRGFTIGFCIRLAYAAIPLLVKHIGTPMKIISTLLRPSFYTKPIRYGSFIAIFVTIFHSFMTISKKSQDWNRHTRAFIGAFISGLSLYIVPSEDRQAIAIFALCRALEVFCKACVSVHILPSWQHADSALFSIATLYIVWAWLYAPWCMDKGYVKFLNTHTGFRDGILHGYAMQVHGAGVHPPTNVQDGIAFGYMNIKNKSNGITLEQIVQNSHTNNTNIQPPSSASSSSAFPLTTTATSETPHSLVSNLASFNAVTDTPSSLSSSLSSPPTTIVPSGSSGSNTLSHPCIRHLTDNTLSKPILLPPDMIQSTNAWIQYRHAVPLNLDSLTDTDKLTCHLLHPHCPTNCFIGHGIDYPLMFVQSLRTYLPVYLLPGVIFRWQTLLSQPLEWFKHIITSTSRSALFFTNMSFGGVLMVCLYRLYIGKYLGNTHRSSLVLPITVSIASFGSILTEQKSKRIELAHFSLSHAIKCFLNLTRSNYPELFYAIPSIINPITIFALSTAIMISASMAASGELLRPTYFNLIRWFLGKDTPGLTNIDIKQHMNSIIPLDDTIMITTPSSSSNESVTVQYDTTIIGTNNNQNNSNKQRDGIVSDISSSASSSPQTVLSSTSLSLEPEIDLGSPMQPPVSSLSSSSMPNTGFGKSIGGHGQQQLSFPFDQHIRPKNHLHSGITPSQSVLEQIS